MARIVVVGLALQLAALGGTVTLIDRLRVERAGATVITGPERALILGSVDPATVRVTGRGCSATVTGTGFVVGDRLLTNAHVAAGAASLDLRPDRAALRGGPLSGPVALALADTGRDLAVTRALEAGPTGLQLAPQDPVAGEAVLVVGRGEGSLRWLEARVQLTEGGSPVGLEGPVILLDRAVTEGWSGGPVLDHRGRVVGVVKGVDRTTGLTIVVPVSTVRRVLGGVARPARPAASPPAVDGPGAGAGSGACG